MPLNSSARALLSSAVAVAATHGCRFGFELLDSGEPGVQMALGGQGGEPAEGGRGGEEPVGGQGGSLPIVCGDGVLSEGESCDTGDAPTTGCNECRTEPGWECPVAGQACSAICGDGIVLGFENCDDAQTPPMNGDGCSSSCRIEPGHGCTGQPSSCTMRDCGNGIIDGDESCDEGTFNGVYYGDGSGCTAFCTREPDCRDTGTDGCVSECGDGMRIDPEECDDGNTANNDGCSSTCILEPGFTCTTETLTDTQPCSYDSERECLQLPVIYRDFIGVGLPDGHDDMYIRGNTRSAEGGGETIDNSWFGLCPNMVDSALNADGKPVLRLDYAGCEENGGKRVIATHESFLAWYAAGHPEESTHLRSFELEKQAESNSYQFSSNRLFPLDGLTRRGELEYCATADYINQEPMGTEPCDAEHHNYHFTSEVRYVFRYQGGEVLDFTGDDDVFVFVNGEKALDLGGVHGQESGSVALDDQGLTLGQIYEIVVFHAERSPTGSNYRLTLAGFEVERTTSCTPL